MVGLLGGGGCVWWEGEINRGFTLHKIIWNAAIMARVTLCIMKPWKGIGKMSTFKTFFVIFFVFLE